jgi:hypothetical protein
LYGYYEDLEYGDDSYWDYFSPSVTSAELKRKRDRAKSQQLHTKRRKIGSCVDDGLGDLVAFHSREKRLCVLKQTAPLLEKPKTPFSFLPDWRERFAEVDGAVESKYMPADMKQAAKGLEQGASTKECQLESSYTMQEEDDDSEYEDEDEEAGQGEDGDIALDPEMLKAILRQKLGHAGLAGMDESAFMDTINKMLSGEDDGDQAANSLTDQVLGKVTSDNGDEALSGWLSQQGVSLESGDDGADDVSKDETTQREGSSRRPTGLSERKTQSPPDSVVSVCNAHENGSKSKHMAVKSTSTAKKRIAPQEAESLRKKPKHVTFDVSASPLPTKIVQDDGFSSEDPLDSGSTIAQNTRPDEAVAIPGASPMSNACYVGRTSSKRKATSAEALDDKPVAKKTKRNEEARPVDSIAPALSEPSTRRTRGPRGKNLK